MSSISKKSFPIILLDCSGSTEHTINITNHIEYKDVNTVLKYELATAQRILSKSNTWVYVILWNFSGIVLSPTPILVSELTKISSESFGGTCLSKGLEAIPEEWLKDNENKELYIFTDGEIEDENYVVEPLKRLCESGNTIQIITVEPNNTNYIKTKGEAGYKIFQTIKSNGLTKSLRRFSSYNEHHVKEPFISFDNPPEIKGFTPFQGQYFNIEEQQDELFDKIEEEINTCKTKDELVKLAHDLTLTSYHMTKDKTAEEQVEINNQIADLFAESTVDPGIFIQVNKMMLLEAGNRINGKACEFHEFKDAMILYSNA